MKDCLMEVKRNIISIHEIEQFCDPGSFLSDTSVRFFGLEWKPVLSTCRSLSQDMVMFLAHLVEKKTRDCQHLGRAFEALDKLENDVGNH